MFARKRQTQVLAFLITCYFTALDISVATAQTAARGGDERRTTLTGFTENDDWPPDTGTDKNYTNGLRITLSRNYDMWNTRRLVSTLDRIIRILPQVPDDLQDCSAAADDKVACASSAVHFGQQFYTPDDIQDRIIPNDRPYAGWRYVEDGGGNRQRTVRVERMSTWGLPDDLRWVGKCRLDGMGLSVPRRQVAGIIGTRQIRDHRSSELALGQETGRSTRRGRTR